MSNIVHDYVEDYIHTLLPESRKFIKDMELYAEENHVPIVQKEVAKLLSLIIKTTKAERILEVGTAIGYSAILMHEAAGNCSIVTIERDEKMIGQAVLNIKKSGLEKEIHILQGDASEVLSNIEDKFDLIFLDAAKGQYLEFFPECNRLLKGGGIIFADNVLFRGMVATNELLIRRKITIVKRMRKYLKFLSENKDYETSILPVGDGVAISLKKEAETNENS